MPPYRVLVSTTGLAFNPNTSRRLSSSPPPPGTLPEGRNCPIVVESWVNTNSEVYELVLVSASLEVVGEGGGGGEAAAELLDEAGSELVDVAIDAVELV